MLRIAILPKPRSTPMTAFLVLLLAALSRLFPHLMHGTGYNFTAVGGGLLFFGSRRPRWQALIAVAVLALTDVYLTTQVYGYAFHVRSYLVTWAWYGAVCLMGSALLRKVTVLRVVAGVLASATSFFLLSNFMVWVRQAGCIRTAWRGWEAAMSRVCRSTATTWHRLRWWRVRCSVCRCWRRGWSETMRAPSNI